MGRKCAVVISVVFLLLAVGTLGFGDKQDGWTLIIAPKGEPPSLDGHEIASSLEGVVLYSVYESLLKYNLETFAVEPSLATSWEISPDARSCVFHLREGVKFHDGTEFNAEAVKFSYERVMGLGLGPSVLLEPVSEVEVLDDYTIKFVTEQPFAFWEDNFASYKGLVAMSPTYVKAHASTDDPWAKVWMHDHTCGTGPYMVSEWRHDEQIEIVRFEGYWRGWTGKEPSKVLYSMAAEPGKRKLMLEKGTIDIAVEIPSDMIPDLAANQDITVQIVGGMAQLYVNMKCSKGPLANRLLRKAVSYALDYDAIARVWYGAIPAQGPIPRASYCHDDTLLIYRQDVERAKLLLAAAGYSPGEVTLSLTYIAGIDWERNLATLIQQNLADIGISVQMQQMPWSVFASWATDSEVSTDMYIYYTAAATADPYIMFWECFAPEALKGAGWNNGYNNPALGAILDRVLIEPNRDVRAELYKEAQRMITEDAPAIFVFEVPFIYTYRSELKGIIPDALYQGYYPYEIWKE